MELLQETVIKVLLDGGWLMIPLALLGAFIYASILEIILYLNKYSGKIVDSDRWGHWIERPDEATGSIGAMVQYVQEDTTDSPTVRRRVSELMQIHMPPIDSRIKFSTILVSTAPLTGLLGTVTGMLSTFSGLAVSSGGSTVDLVAGGISEALITTQTGLVLAIPGYVLIHLAKRKRGELEVFFNQLEILTIQHFEKINFRKAS